MTRYPITPCPAPRMNVRSRFNPKHAAPIARYFAFREQCALYGVTIPERAWIRFEMPVPRSKAGLQRAGQAHRQRPDLDNLIKGLLDSVLTEDSHVWEIRAEKRWALVGSITVGELP